MIDHYLRGGGEKAGLFFESKRHIPSFGIFLSFEGVEGGKTTLEDIVDFLDQLFHDLGVISFTAKQVKHP